MRLMLNFHKKILLGLVFFIILVLLLVIKSKFNLTLLSDKQNQDAYIFMTKLLNPWYQLTSLSSPDNLPTYSLNIKPKDVIRMITDLPTDTSELLTSGNKVYVPAEFIAPEGQIFPAQAAVRGESSPHWANNKKSIAVRLTQDSWRQNTKFSFILPELRGYVDEAVALKLAAALGLVTPKFEYAKLVINNDDQGVYFVIEDLTDAFLHQLDPGNTYTIYGEEQVDLVHPINLYTKAGKWKIMGTTNTKPNFAPIERLQTAYELKSNPEFFTAIAKIVDIEAFLKWQALSFVLGDHHQDDIHNNRLIYNDSTQKFSFIPVNVYIFSTAKNLVKVYPNNSLAKRILQNPLWLKRRNQIVWEVITSNKMLEVINQVKIIDTQIRKGIFFDSKKLPSNLMYAHSIEEKLTTLKENQEYLQFELSKNKDSFDLNQNEPQK